MTAVSRTYRTSSDALEVAEILESFGLKASVALVVSDTDIGETTGWEVSLAVPTEQSRPPLVARPDPLDLDEVVDYIDSHWDREAEDRDINSRRRHREF